MCALLARRQSGWPHGSPRSPELHGLQRLLELLALLDALARLPRRSANPLASEGFVPTLNLTQAKRLETVCRFVHLHFQNPIRLAEVRCAGTHLAPEAFSRFFKQKTGKPFVNFLNDVRVGEACRLLIEKEALGVTEICYACGFGNVSNFNRHFRLRHALSPREFRSPVLGHRDRQRRLISGCLPVGIQAHDGSF